MHDRGSMSIEPLARRTFAFRILCAIGVVGLYLSLTVGIVYWHFTQELAAGNTPNEMRFYEGSVKDGEFWYRVSRASGNPLSPKMTTRLARIHLESGVERDTEFAFDEDYVLPVWLGDELFVFTRRTIYQAVGHSMVKLTPAPFSFCASPPFLYDGHPTVIYDARGLNDDSDENARLAHWIDGRWVEGRRIVLPGWGRFWIDDPQSGRKVLFPRTSVSNEVRISSPTSYYFEYHLLVAQHLTVAHLMLAEMSGMCSAYRRGFEFLEEDSVQASALAPENSPPDVSGWEPILAERAGDDWMQMVCDHDGLVFASTEKPARFVRHFFDGRREELTSDASHETEKQTAWIAVDNSRNLTYVIHSDPFWCSATIRRIEGSVLRAPHLIVPGFQKEYVARWCRVCLRLLSVWLVPIIISICVADRFTRRSAVAAIAAAGHPIKLASVRRRSVAFLLDLLVLSTIAWLCWRFFLVSFGLAWPMRAEPALPDTLTTLDWGIRNGMFAECWRSLRDSSLDWLTLPFDIHSPFFGVLVASILPICFVKVYVEGRYGLTPGKWLMGVRTVRTTQRSCGMARALLRDAAYCLDIPFLLTPIPALISLILSDNHQRIGDRLADTIVVEARFSKG